MSGSSRYGVKALFFDVFGTLVDWRTGVAREAESHLKPRGYALDWLAFADGWRAQYEPGIAEVRLGAGFRMPATQDHPRAREAGVRKAPMHEIAGSGARGECRAMGIWRQRECGEVEPRPAIRSPRLEAWGVGTGVNERIAGCSTGFAVRPRAKFVGGHKRDRCRARAGRHAGRQCGSGSAARAS